MIVHGVRDILTFNVSDFTRYPDIRVLAADSFPRPSTT